MKHFIIDGYNALFKIKGKLKKQYQTREGFIQYIRTTKIARSARNKISLVFDGAKAVSFKDKPSFSPINVVFSKDETADDKIVKMARRQENKREVIVVTDDREVQERVKILGCSAVPVTLFFKELTRRKGTNDREKPNPDKGEGKNITEEMKKIWGVYQ